MTSTTFMEASETGHSSIRCGIVLSAGEGKRLKPFIQQLRGDTLPKQYVSFSGTGSMLEQTYFRAERLIPGDRIFTVIDPLHLEHAEVCRQICRRPKGTVVLQPKNKETGPGLLLPLTHLSSRYPDSTVAVFPSDHYIEQEALFTNYVDLAFRLIEEDPSKVILLGIQPHSPDPEYGYILPGEEIKPFIPSGARSVSCFIEKPVTPLTEELIRHGALWNTMVMVFKTRTLLNLVRNLVPQMYIPFEEIGKCIGTPSESEVVEAVYRDLQPANFSKDFLEILSIEAPASLALLPVQGVYWNDWGSAQRIVGDLKRIGCLDPLEQLQLDHYAAA